MEPQSNVLGVEWSSFRRSRWSHQHQRYLTEFNSLNPELNPICYLLALLGARHFLHVSRIRVKSLTLRLLMSYIYIYIYIYIHTHTHTHSKTCLKRNAIVPVFFSVFTGFRFTKSCVLIKQSTKNMIA